MEISYHSSISETFLEFALQNVAVLHLGQNEPHLTLWLNADHHLLLCLTGSRSKSGKDNLEQFN